MKNDYHERKERKLENAQRLAAKREQESSQTYNEAKKMADVIPFGQPILVGHHSERGDRNYRKRIEKKMNKSVELQRTAEYWKARAESLMNNNAISSDDPDAIEKLREKLQRLEDTQELMVQCNKVLRNKKLSDIEKIAKLTQELGLKESTAIKILSPDRFGGMGFPQFRLTNNNANIHRIRDRVKLLERTEAIGDKSEQHGSIELKVNQEVGRVQLLFPGKPDEETRKLLKSNGFVWSPTQGAWQRRINPMAVHIARNIAVKLNLEKPGVKQEQATASRLEIDPDNRGGTGHGDVSHSDADPGL